MWGRVVADDSCVVGLGDVVSIEGTKCSWLLENGVGEGELGDVCEACVS